MIQLEPPERVLNLKKLTLVAETNQSIIVSKFFFPNQICFSTLHVFTKITSRLHFTFSMKKVGTKVYSFEILLLKSQQLRSFLTLLAHLNIIIECYHLRTGTCRNHVEGSKIALHHFTLSGQLTYSCQVRIIKHLRTLDHGLERKASVPHKFTKTLSDLKFQLPY